MWYDDRSSMLAMTVPYRVGYDTIEKINVHIEPIKRIHVGNITTKYLLGIPFESSDLVE